MVIVRSAIDSDASGIRDLFRAAYGDDYCYPQFFDPSLLRKLILADDSIVVVAVDEGTGQILGTASVLEEKGAYTDLTGEFGRLVVHPEARRQGIGHKLMQGRLERVRNRLHIGLIEARIVHPFSCRIAAAHDFSIVGYLPAKLQMAFRENLGLMVRHFGHALELRRNHPRIIPEAYQIAHLALGNCSMQFDAIVDEESAPYPYEDDFEIEELTTDGWAALLRIERGRLRKREIFGPLRLQYGFFKLRATNAHYLIVKDKGRLVGAVGFTLDAPDRVISVFELICMQDNAVRFLLSQLLRRCLNDHDAAYIEIDVSAYAPGMQRTLLELGFLPVGYIPAQVFHRTERLDIVKMVRLTVPLNPAQDRLIPEALPMAEHVIASFTSREIQPRILEALDHMALFSGLNEEQMKRVASTCRLEVFETGATIFEEGTDSDKLYLIMKGNVEVHVGDRLKKVGSVGAGECLGEVSALSKKPHAATACAAAEVEAAVVSRDDFERLIRHRPDIGVALYRNLALGLGSKLQRSDLALLQK